MYMSNHLSYFFWVLSTKKFIFRRKKNYLFSFNSYHLIIKLVMQPCGQGSDAKTVLWITFSCVPHKYGCNTNPFCLVKEVLARSKKENFGLSLLDELSWLSASTKKFAPAQHSISDYLRETFFLGLGPSIWGCDVWTLVCIFKNDKPNNRTTTNFWFLVWVLKLTVLDPGVIIQEWQDNNRKTAS